MLRITIESLCFRQSGGCSSSCSEADQDYCQVDQADAGDVEMKASREAGVLLGHSRSVWLGFTVDHRAPQLARVFNLAPDDYRSDHDFSPVRIGLTKLSLCHCGGPVHLNHKACHLRFHNWKGAKRARCP